MESAHYAHHDHAHHHAEGVAGNRLLLAFGLTAVILVVEVIAGLRANSLALLSDAGHILTDVFALGLAWFATRLSRRPADERNTYGYRRSGILAALLNAVTLVVIALAVAVEAVLRLQHPERVTGALVMIAAAGAVVINLFIAANLHGAGEHNLNVRAALLHVVGDIAASVGVIVSGAAILLWHAYILDPIISLAIAALIAFGAWRIVGDTVGILMEATPRGLDLDEIQHAMLQIPGVQDVHDLHVWALSDGFHLLTAHVGTEDQSLGSAAHLVSDLKFMLRQRFHIEHATIEVECSDCRQPRRRPIRFVPRS